MTSQFVEPIFVTSGGGAIANLCLLLSRLRKVTITEADYAAFLALLANRPVKSDTETQRQFRERENQWRHETLLKSLIYRNLWKWHTSKLGALTPEAEVVWTDLGGQIRNASQLRQFLSAHLGSKWKHEIVGLNVVQDLIGLCSGVTVTS